VDNTESYMIKSIKQIISKYPRHDIKA
jgi:hypothetical protein